MVTVQDDGLEAAARAAHCETEADLYRAPARVLIGTLCREFLDAAHITPLELLHCPRHQNKLLDNGEVMQRAVRRVAALQVKNTDQTAESRAKELHHLVDKILIDTPMRAAKYRGPALAPNRLNQTFDKIKAEVAEDEQEFQIFRSLSDYLMDTPDWREKFFKFLDLFNEPPNPENAGYLDVLLAEMIDSPAALEAVLGPHDALYDQLLDVAALEGGHYPGQDDQEGAPIAMMIAATRDRFPLVATRKSLTEKILGALHDAPSLTDGSALAEAGALSRLYKLMDDESGSIGHAKVMRLVADRMTGLMSPEQVSAMIQEQSTLERRLRLLVALHDLMIGHENRSSILGKIKYLLQDFHFEPEILSGKDALDSLKIVGRLHWTFRTSEIGGRVQKKILERLADIQTRHIKQQNLFATLNKLGRDSAERAVILIDLCAQHTFTDGDNLDSARKLIGHYIGQQNFKTALADVVAADDDPRGRIDQLRRNLLSIGIDPGVLQ